MKRQRSILEVRPKHAGWEDLKSMDRYYLEMFLGHRCGKDVGWIANVINTSQKNPKTKLMGLAHLAALGLVRDVPFEIDLVFIDGQVHPLSELEKYAKGLQPLSTRAIISWLKSEEAIRADAWVYNLAIDELATREK